MEATKTRIEKARDQYRTRERSKTTKTVEFRKAIEDNLPPQIPVEAVEQLREKRAEKLIKIDARDDSDMKLLSLISINEFIRDINDLLPKQTDGN